MILELYFALILIAFILIGIGYYVEIAALELFGYALIFSLGISLLGNLIEYRTGENTNQTYSYDNGSIDTIQETMLYTYSSMDNDTSHFFGFCLSLAGVFGFASYFFRMKEERDN